MRNKNVSWNKSLKIFFSDYFLKLENIK